jgi:F-type H+-transporting ATPase subunit b
MRVGMIIGFVLIALILAAPASSSANGPLLAVDPGAGGKDKAGGEKEAVNPWKGGIELTLWSMVVFLILFSILAKYAWPQIREGLDKREHGIAKDRREADRARQEAEQVRSQCEAEMARANDKIREMVDKAQKDAQQTAAEELARGRAKLAEENEQKKRELSIQVEDAKHKMTVESVQLATLISTKAIKKHLTDADHRALLDEALAEFRSAAQSRRQDLESARA